MVGQISHDLRTPLNGIVVNLNLAVSNISREEPEVIQEDYLKPALMNCDQLTYLVNDILTFTQDDFNQDPRVVYESINIREEMDSIKPAFILQSQTKEIDMIF